MGDAFTRIALATLVSLVEVELVRLRSAVGPLVTANWRSRNIANAVLALITTALGTIWVLADSCLGGYRAGSNAHACGASGCCSRAGTC